jgi:hypothetical protein
MNATEGRPAGPGTAGPGTAGPGRVRPGQPSEEIGRYLAGVRAAVSDLPVAVREELLEELPTHLAEVAAETSGAPGALEERLGSPARYAADLRAAAGLSPGPTGGGGPGLAASLARADRALGRMLGYPRLSDFLRVLAPGWWILRAVLVTLIAVAFLVDFDMLTPRRRHLFVTGLVVGAVSLVASIRLGRRATAGPGRRPAGTAGGAAVVLANLLIAVAGGWLVLVLLLVPIPTRAGPVYDPYPTVQDVHPVGPDGRPLNGVQLYDQAGNPIQLGHPENCPTPPPMDVQAWRYPLCVSPSPTVPPVSSPVPSGSR